MFEETFKDFKLVEKVSEETIKKYEDKLPNEMIGIWKEYGYGQFMGGYFKLINPDDYIDFVRGTYYNGKISIPLMLTGFGDVVVWRPDLEENDKQEGFLTLLHYKYEDVEVLSSGMDFIWDDFIKSKSCREEELELKEFEEAVKMHGEIGYDECFGYVPILAIGGSKKTENLQKVKIREHLDLIVGFTGGIF